MRCARFILPVALTLLFPALALAADPAAGEGSDPVSQMMPKVAPALFNLLMFLALFFVLAKFVWPKILSGLQAREKKIHDDLTHAQEARDTAQKLKLEFDQKLAEAHAESRKLLDQARADAEQLRVKLKADTEAEMGDLRKHASDEITLAKQQALDDLNTHAAELATAVAGKVLGRQIEDADTQRLVDESLAELNRLN